MRNDGTVHWAKELTTARSAAAAGAAIVQATFDHADDHATPASYQGGIGNITTAVDDAASHAILAALAVRYPEDAVWSESAHPGQQVVESAARLWLVDPLDGTHNHRHAVPYCATSIALRVQGELVVGVVHDLRGRAYAATAADQPIARLDPVRLDTSVVALVTDYSREGRDQLHDIAGRLGGRVERLTQLWAPALDLAHLAAGRLHAMVCIGSTLLDVAAGLLLVQAAGGPSSGSTGPRCSQASCDPAGRSSSSPHGPDHWPMRCWNLSVDDVWSGEHPYQHAVSQGRAVRGGRRPSAAPGRPGRCLLRSWFDDGCVCVRRL